MRTARSCALAMVLLPAAWMASCGGRDDAAARVRIGRHAWTVELALDDSSRQRGLAGRDEVPPGTGMLFVFPQERLVHFHMLNCRVGLDVAFISSGLRIVEIRTMPVEDDPSDPKVSYSSRRPVRFALEVAAGAFARTGVKVGDRVELLGRARDAIKEVR